MPVIETGAGNCHIFVDATADFDMADRIVINAKTQRPSVCNAAEKLLVHQSVAAEYIPRIVKKLIDAGVEVRGDGKARALAQGQPVSLAPDQDWYEEYLRLCMAIAVVANVDDAIAHINKFSTKHSDSIITADESNAPQVPEGRGFRRGLLECLHPLHRRQPNSASAPKWASAPRNSTAAAPSPWPELTSSKYEIVGTGQVR